MRFAWFAGTAVLAVVGTAGAGNLEQTVGIPGLELRAWTDQIAETGRAVPRDAVRVFVYEGRPSSVQVTDRYIAVDYGRSGVLFDRATGAAARRLTVADSWPAHRPAEFGPQQPRYPARRFVGPGVLNPHGAASRAAEAKPQEPPDVPAVEVEFGDRQWRAMQPGEFLRSVERERPQRAGPGPSWTSALRRLNERSYVEAAAPGRPARRYTTADGLPGNIVTHLVPFDRSLWGACVDIYDPRTKQWGPGGLARFNPQSDRWERIDHIDGRPVRWVTLLEAHGGELWVGYREGAGVEGDEIHFGMGLYPGMYRPVARAITLARLAQGRWTTFSRPPRADQPNRYMGEEKRAPSTEYPVRLARLEGRVILYTEARAPQISGSWDVPLEGQVSLIDVAGGRWRDLDAEKDLDADQLFEFTAERGETLVSSNRGVHRFDGQEAWRRLDAKCDLRNPTIDTAAAAGKELWIGYGRQSFGEMGAAGISRYDESAGRWTHLGPADLGTASPVRRIAAIDGGDVWVLFAERPVLSSAGPFIYYRREVIPRPTGLGRFSAGKWEFPAAGAPQPGRGTGFFMIAPDLVALGDTLLYSTGVEVYAGPRPWKKIATGEVLGITLAADRKAVEIIRRERSRELGNQPAGFTHGVYRPGGAEVRFEPYKFRDPWDQYALMSGDSLMAPEGGHSYQQWVPLSVNGARRAIGPFHGSDSIRTFPTDRAVWFFSRGELVRVERAALK